MAVAGVGQQSALVCEGVHAHVDIQAFQGSFDNNIKGSEEKVVSFFCLSSITQSTCVFQLCVVYQFEIGYHKQFTHEFNILKKK